MGVPILGLMAKPLEMSVSGIASPLLQNGCRELLAVPGDGADDVLRIEHSPSGAAARGGKGSLRALVTETLWKSDVTWRRPRNKAMASSGISRW